MAHVDVLNIALERGDTIRVSEHMVIVGCKGLSFALAVRDPDVADVVAAALLEAAHNVRASSPCKECQQPAVVQTSFGPYCAECVYDPEVKS